MNTLAVSEMVQLFGMFVDSCAAFVEAFVVAFVVAYGVAFVVAFVGASDVAFVVGHLAEERRANWRKNRNLINQEKAKKK